MIERLESIEKRYEELTELLIKQETISDKERYQALAKESANLSEIVSKYREYKKLLSELEGLKTILEKETKDIALLELAKEELPALEQKKLNLQRELEELLLDEQKSFDKDLIMEIRAGTGGSEATLFVADLFRMYSKFAASNSWKIELIDSHTTESGGFKEIVFSVKGKEAYKKLRFEKGVHRVQRVPATEAQGRIHTSTVTVAVLPEPEEVELRIDTKDLKIDVFRASGPGGQHVNKTDSAVRLTHLPTGLVVVCQDERSQIKNREKAMRVLRARLLEKMKAQQEDKIAKERQQQIGRGERSEKIRTYNYPDRRITDHRIGLTLHKLDEIMEGSLGGLTEALLESDRKARLESKAVVGD